MGGLLFEKTQSHVIEPQLVLAHDKHTLGMHKIFYEYNLKCIVLLLYMAFKIAAQEVIRYHHITTYGYFK